MDYVRDSTVEFLKLVVMESNVYYMCFFKEKNIFFFKLYKVICQFEIVTFSKYFNANRNDYALFF